MFHWGSLRMIKNIVLIFCAILVINGTALAADRDVIVGFHQSDVTAEEKLIHDNGGKLKKDFHLINAVSASVPEANIEKMKKDQRIKYIVNDSIFSATDEYSSSWGVQYIGSGSVHTQGINGAGVKIAVLDTGIDYNHSDLKNIYKGGYDFINNDPDPWDDNCLSFFKTCHGTHVSGIIAAEQNEFGVVGVAPGASIYAVKVLDAGGFGHASLVVSGIEWAVANDMNIISMSLESTENNTAVLEAVNAAYNSGILLVAAGGNTDGGSVQYPAAYDSVIAVAAIDQAGQRASFSPIDSRIEVAAPGVDIYSTVQGGYNFLTGTSMAAPHVTGVAALIFSTDFADVNLDGLRDNEDVREIIRNSAFDAGSPGKDDVYGYGIVDASKALPPDLTLLTLIRTKGSPTGDMQEVTLSNGKYSINIHNVNLAKVDMKVYENGVLQKSISRDFEFNKKKKDKTFDIDVNDASVAFIPYGKKGSIAHIEIKKS
jgi:subtilisin